MGKKAFIGVSSKAHQVKKMYLGVSGKAHKVKKGYLGVGGKAHQFFASEHSLWAFRVGTSTDPANSSGQRQAQLMALDENTAAIITTVGLASYYGPVHQAQNGYMSERFIITPRTPTQKVAQFYDYNTGALLLNKTDMSSIYWYSGGVNNSFFGVGNQKYFYDNVAKYDYGTFAATSLIHSDRSSRSFLAVSGGNTSVWFLHYAWYDDGDTSVYFQMRDSASNSVIKSMTFNTDSTGSLDFSQSILWRWYNWSKSYNTSTNTMQIQKVDSSSLAVTATVWQASKNSVGTDPRQYIQTIGGRFK